MNPSPIQWGMDFYFAKAQPKNNSDHSANTRISFEFEYLNQFKSTFLKSMEWVRGPVGSFFDEKIPLISRMCIFKHPCRHHSGSHPLDKHHHIHGDHDHDHDHSLWVLTATYLATWKVLISAAKGVGWQPWRMTGASRSCRPWWAGPRPRQAPRRFVHIIGIL
jgi:hypothetical protein